MKILFCGDTHFSSRTPASRIDDYAATGLRKLRQIGLIARENKCGMVVFTGDFFNIREQPWFYVEAVISELMTEINLAKEMKQELSFWTIVGNSHDIPYDRFDLLKRTPLGVMITAGVINLLDRVALNSVEIVGQSIGELKWGDFKKPNNKESIFIVHAFYQEQFEDMYFMTPETIDSLGYKVVVMGHDHVPYGIIITPGGTTIIRPGSLMRGTSHGYQLVRDVHVWVLDTNDWSTQDITLDVIPSEQVFSTKAVEKDIKDKFSLNKALAFVDSLVKQYQESKNSVYLVLDKMKLGLNIKSYIELKLKEAGIYRL